MHEDICKEIAQMAEADQRMRQGVGAWNSDLDQRHTERIKDIVKKIGWPAVSKVGKDIADQAWLLVQHADHDVIFQRYCLELMKHEAINEVDQANIAYLEDRVLLNEGKPQLYGTQFRREADETFGPRPIQDKEYLDERRKAMGLEPFSVYEEHMRSMNSSNNDKG